MQDRDPMLRLFRTFNTDEDWRFKQYQKSPQLKKLKNVTPEDAEHLSDEQRQALAWDEHPDNPKFDKELQ